MEKIQTKATILIIPGLRDHVPEHWQTILETKLVKVRSVPPVETNKLNCENRVVAIQAQLEQIQGPVILVAHSAGVLMTIHWAAKYQRPIQGALLVAPPDLNESWPENYPIGEVGHLNPASGFGYWPLAEQFIQQLDQVEQPA